MIRCCFGFLGEVAFAVVVVSCFDAEFVGFFNHPSELGGVFGARCAAVGVLGFDEVAVFVSGDGGLPASSVRPGFAAGDGVDGGALGGGLSLVEFVVVVDVFRHVAFAVGVAGYPVGGVAVLPGASFGVGEGL